MTHGSLFSGIGGFDLAAEWMGWSTAFTCEIDSFCSRVLKYHFPNAEHYGDIKNTDFTKWRGKIDILSGGFPCQPFSLAGKRKGADDDRYLWPEMLRVIREIRPTWIVGENVAGILTMVQPGDETPVASEASIFGESYEEVEIRQQYVTETVCTDLEYEGYSVQPLVIPACAVKAPHRRDRVWFVARRTDAGAETLQYGRKDGVYAAGTSSDTHGYGRPEETQREQEASEEANEQPESILDSGTVSNAITYCEKGIVGNANGKRWKKHLYSSEPSAEEKRSNIHACQGRIIPGWKWFPTQSPVCGGDDGLSARLDGISFPRWRAESVKAYGNAVVPQVAYEIFRAIEMAENEKTV